VKHIHKRTAIGKNKGASDSSLLIVSEALKKINRAASLLLSQSGKR